VTSASERIIGLYEDNAAAWDKGRGGPFFEKPWLDRFLALIPAGGDILDIGCGGGQPIARYFIEQGFGVTGVDSSPSLVGICQVRFPAHTWVTADMRVLDLGRAFEGLIAWNSFFHLSPEDQRAMFPIFRRHAAPGAALMFTSGRSHGDNVGSWQGEPLYHGSLDGDEYRALLAENSFEIVAHAPEDPDCGHGTIWLARRA
jgi:SAM-dependent methyltransferase